MIRFLTIEISAEKEKVKTVHSADLVTPSVRERSPRWFAALTKADYRREIATASQTEIFLEPDKPAFASSRPSWRWH